MLVLSRVRGSSILIGDDIEIKMLKTMRGSVVVGITAPKGTKILRNELHVKAKGRSDLGNSVVTENTSSEVAAVQEAQGDATHDRVVVE